MLRTATIRSLGTMPNAKIRIRTPYAPARSGSVTQIAAKISKNTTHATPSALRAGFSLILGLNLSFAGLLTDENPQRHCSSERLAIRDLSWIRSEFHLLWEAYQLREVSRNFRRRYTRKRRQKPAIA
jgi:hypothetical protein